MGWLDNILGKKEEPKKEKKKSTKKTATKKTATKKEEIKKETKKEIVAKGPEKKLKIKTTWTKGKLDKLSTVELHKVAKDNGVKVDGLTKTQIYSKIVKG